MPEILAPAGSPESVYAAVRCGADAVYLGGESFNARRNASNFTYEQLGEAVAYCHAHGVKVHHTLNTLVKDSEMNALKQELERILALGGDALILQDLGVLSIVKAMCPEMELHASTQLSAHSLGAVQELERLGFSRVVLAREMSLEEIAYIRKNTAVELEVFVHGALCMCVSGQCYFSAFLGSRSGNRGLCAQPCRLPFQAPGGTGYDLSLKDNSVLEMLPALEALGIDSSKIEGRMKRPEYVAASVRACCGALRGSYTAQEKEKLQSIFSRQGFTDGYLSANRGKNMFGLRTREDVTAANNRLLKEYAALYAKEVPKIACDMVLTIQKDAFPTLQITAKEKSITATGQTKPEAALHRPLNEQELSARLSKLGGTAFFARDIQVRLEDGLMLSAGEINALRRSAVKKLEEALSATHHYAVQNTMPPLPNAKEKTKKQVYLRFSDISQCHGLTMRYDKILLPIEQAEEAVRQFGTEKLILETPRVFFGKEKQLIALLEKAKALGVKQISAGNIGAVFLARQSGFEILAGLGTNIFNSYAAAEIDADSILLSIEMTTAQINHLQSDKPCGNILYGYMPLMITRNCPLNNGRSCKHCDKKGYITDRKGERLHVRCRFGASEIFNPHALYMIDKEDEIHSDFSLLYFTTESPKEVAHILDLYQSGSKADFKFTRGLYSKGVL